MNGRTRATPTWLLSLAFEATGARHAALRITSALLFFLSFALNSLMALYLFAMIGLFIAMWRADDEERRWWHRLVVSAWRCVSRYPELVVLPLVYWGALNIWFKRIGGYASDYGMRLPTFSGLREGWDSFFQCGYSNSIARAARP